MAISALEVVNEYVAYLSPQKRTMRLPFSLLLFSLLLFSSCATSHLAERRFSKKIQKEVEKSPVFNRAFTGFTLLDPATGKTLADVNGDKYFTPASNTKILTLATCLEVLGDSVPGLQVQRYSLNEDENRYVLLIKGTGDPTFLHPKFQDWRRVFEWLKSSKDTLKIYPRKSEFERFGPGWAWDDYIFDYQVERSRLPIYGNLVQLKQNAGDFLVNPPFFKDNFLEPIFIENVRRREWENLWFLPFKKTESSEQWLPFTHVDLGKLLSDTLKVQVEELTGFEFEYVPDNWRTLYSTPLDTVLHRMMHQSDNFIAEQMLLVCAGQKFDILQQDTMIKWMLDSVLTSLPQRPRWVDGSGLSRYNLISPRDLVQVLLKLWKEQPQEFLLSLFPAGGMNGTVTDWYKGKYGKPYVFAKTGSMSGVHCLSGYVVTKRGKTLIFSFMHNNFVGSNRAWKEEMQRVLELIWERY